MTSLRLQDTLAIKRQHLLIEFSGLKYACPHGVFTGLSPGDPTLWSGVIFIRKGPYAPAILRFQISFPPAYPTLPPLVTFSTDMFHPLITPLTTYMYTTDIQDGGTVSATDDERLPPGGFSLRHGFPDWFGRASKNVLNSRHMGMQHPQTPVKSPRGSLSSPETPDSGTSSGQDAARSSNTPQHQVSVYDVLYYIRSTFDDVEVLDNVPLEAAGNPGAWHAWRAYRGKNGKVLPPSLPRSGKEGWHDGPSDDEEGLGVPEGYQRLPGGTSPLASKRPGDWNWSGVWEVRVKKGVDLSLAESVLYGNSASNDDLIRFLKLDDDQLQAVKENLKRSIGATR